MPSRTSTPTGDRGKSNGGEGRRGRQSRRKGRSGHMSPIHTDDEASSSPIRFITDVFLVAT